MMDDALPNASTSKPKSSSLTEQYNDVVHALATVETGMRLKYHPQLVNRAEPIEVDAWNDQQQQEKQHNPSTNQGCTSSIIKKKDDDNDKDAAVTAAAAAADDDDLVDPTAVAIIVTEMDNTDDGNDDDKKVFLASIKRQNVKGPFLLGDHSNSTQRMIPSPTMLSSMVGIINFEMISVLDVSHNEITDLPGLSLLKNLLELNMNRNWFNTLPNDIGALSKLQRLIASRNFLRPNETSLQLDQLRRLPKLKLIDLRYNQKCGRSFHRERIFDALSTVAVVTSSSESSSNTTSSSATTTTKEIEVEVELPPKLQILMTIWDELGTNNGSGTNQYVGDRAAVRPSHLLRSQLEPLGTVALRKRLVCDFHQIPTDPQFVDRGGVMQLLLKAYHDEQLAYVHHLPPIIPSDSSTNMIIDYNGLIGNRKILYVDGIPVSSSKLDAIQIELHKWTKSTGLNNKNRERPSIYAKNYMILRKPIPMLTTPSVPINKKQHNTMKRQKRSENSNKKSRREIRKLKKMEQYRKLWKVAIDALHEVDPEYALNKCTEIAVTYGFNGSPHIDKQNCGPFYGLSLGNFTTGGNIVVESSARVTISMNTHNKLGKIDGRYVHWVEEWGGGCNGNGNDIRNDSKSTDTTNINNMTNKDSTSTTKNEKSSMADDTATTNHYGDNTVVVDCSVFPKPSPTIAPVERYSLIYYETGNEFIKPGPAVFTIPRISKQE